MRKNLLFLLAAILLLTTQPASAAHAPKAFFGDYEPTKYRGNFLNSGVFLIQFIPSDPFYSSKGHVWAGYPNLDDLWGLKLMNMAQAWDFSKGEGIIIAVVDSGVSPHVDLVDNLLSGYR
jgi:hypothetical protein